MIGSLGTRYRLRIDHVHNITWFKRSGIAGGYLCAGPEIWFSNGGYLPDEDYVLGQVLSLVSDEKEFLSHANFQGSGADRPWLDRTSKSWIERIARAVGLR